MTYFDFTTQSDTTQLTQSHHNCIDTWACTHRSNSKILQRSSLSSEFVNYFLDDLRSDRLLLPNGVAFRPLRRLDNILGTRVIKRIWVVSRKKGVESFQGGMHHDQNRV